MNNVRRALAQTSVSAANTLHPSMLAARLSFALCSGPAPSQTHHQSRDYFWKHDTAAAATQHQEYTYTNTEVSRICAAADGSPLFPVALIILSMGLLAPSSPSRVEILTAHQPASQRALTNGHFRPRRSRVKRHLTALSIHCHFFFFLSLSFAFAAIFNGESAQRLAHMQAKLAHYLCNLI